MRKLIAFALMLALAGSAMAYDLGNVGPTKPVDNTVYENPEQPRQGGNTIFEAFEITIPGTYTGTTAGYSDDYDEVCPYTGSTAPDVVYSVLLDAAGFFTFDLCYSGYDTKLYIRDEFGTLIGCNDDAHFGAPCGMWTSMLEGVELASGITYYVFIDGYGGSDFGAYQLDVTEFTPPEVECPDGAQLEGEPPLVFDYVDNHNGGCNTDEANPPFQFITEPDFCGVSGWYTTSAGASRDTDWFLVEIPAGGQLIITGESEYPMFMFELGPQDCPTAVVVQDVPIDYGMPATLTVNGTPGSLVWLWLGPQEFSGPVNEFDYVLQLNIEGTVATESHTWSSVKSIFE